MVNFLSKIVFLIIITTCISFVAGDTDNNPPLRIESLYQNIQLSMEQPLTLEDIKKNTNLMGTIARYASDRYRKNYFGADEAVEDFLSEYRGIQNNTVNALTFANYASEIKDENYKAQLGQLYNTFDDELENFSDVEDIGSGLAAAGEILAYNIADPINLLGFGAGKAIASTAGRGAIKGLMGQVFKTASKRPVLAGALTGAAVEGPIGVATEA